jgi:hypothetical protein
MEVIRMSVRLKDNLYEVLLAVLPITLVTTILQVFVIALPTVLFLRFLIGAFLVMVGLTLFLQGVKMGLLPMGETIGAELPQKASLPIILLVAFLLGFLVTVAEPDVRVLAFQVDLVSEGEVSKNILILAVALGVAVFVCMAVLRIILGVPITYLLAGGYTLVLLLSFFTPPDFVPLSFDAGGVTTGPVTVPFILALGIGTASVLGGRSSISDGFGLVGLASIGPILAVMILGVIYR